MNFATVYKKALESRHMRIHFRLGTQEVLLNCGEQEHQFFG